jgi:hypothetical protein
MVNPRFARRRTDSIVFTDKDRHSPTLRSPRLHHLQHHEKRFVVLFDLRPLMPMAGIFNRQFVQTKFFLHDFKLDRFRIRKSDPNKAIGLVDKKMNLVNRDIGKPAAILIDDTIDEHVMPFANFR